MESSRRQTVAQTVSAEAQKAKADIERDKEKEAERRRKKEEKREELMDCTSYRMMEGISKWLDKYFLDGIIGLIPVVGDISWTVFGLPFIYFSLFKVRSIPLTLAVTFNVLIDCLLGMIPFFIGNIIDFFHRSYLKNMRLVVGYVNDDKEVIAEVRRKAVWTAIFIAIICYLIYLLVSFLISAAESAASLFEQCTSSL